MFFPQGSYTCGKCKPGFVGDGFIGCRPGDLCASGKHDCHLNATCITLGSERFYCQVGRKVFQRRFLQSVVWKSLILESFTMLSMLENV